MFATSDLIVTTHFFVLLSFIAVTSLLMVLTVLNRLRVRRVCMSWHNGRVFGLPLSPLVFGVLICLLLTVAIFQDQNLGMTVLAGYVVGAGFWFVSAVLSTTVLVTDYALILNVNSPAQALKWSQIADYFEFHRGKQSGYVFFMVDPSGKRIRVELTVPSRFMQRFQLLLQDKLDVRFEYPAEQEVTRHSPLQG